MPGAGKKLDLRSLSQQLVFFIEGEVNNSCFLLRGKLTLEHSVHLRERSKVHENTGPFSLRASHTMAPELPNLANKKSRIYLFKKINIYFR